jgi:hypothetical protein
VTFGDLPRHSGLGVAQRCCRRSERASLDHLSEGVRSA